MNAIDESGILGIATRLSRLSDQLRKEGFQILKENGIDFETKWFPVIYTLHLKPNLSVVELAAEIRYTHPSTIALLKELEAVRLIQSKRHPSDERKRILSLSKKGEMLIKKMQPVWKIMISAVTELTDTKNNLMAAVEEVEAQLRDKSFFERAKHHMQRAQ